MRRDFQGIQSFCFHSIKKSIYFFFYFGLFVFQTSVQAGNVTSSPTPVTSPTPKSPQTGTLPSINLVPNTTEMEPALMKADPYEVDNPLGLQAFENGPMQRQNSIDFGDQVIEGASSNPYDSFTNTGENNDEQGKHLYKLKDNFRKENLSTLRSLIYAH